MLYTFHFLLLQGVVNLLYTVGPLSCDDCISTSSSSGDQALLLSCVAFPLDLQALFREQMLEYNIVLLIISKEVHAH